MKAERRKLKKEKGIKGEAKETKAKRWKGENEWPDELRRIWKEQGDGYNNVEGVGKTAYELQLKFRKSTDENEKEMELS